MSINGVNSNRITGLATGLDTDQLIKNMMRAEQTKVDKYKQVRQLDQWKQEFYVDITKDLRNLKSDYFDILKSGDNNLLKYSNYNTFKSTIIDEDKKYLDVSANVGAIKGNYKVKLEKLASSAKVQSNLGENTELNLNEKLSKYTGSNANIDEEQNLKITVGKDIFEFKVPKDSDMTLDDFIREVKSTKIKDKNGDEKNLGSIISINSSTISNKLTIETIETGDNASIKIEGTVAEKLGIATSGEVNGNDAEIYVKLPGEKEYARVTSNKNIFIKDNITFNLKEVTEGKEISFGLQPDATEVVDKISKFVDSYNELIEKIETLTNETKTGYKPLTDEEKSAMTKEQIDKWESQAKKGLFKNDRQLQSMISGLRRSFSDGIQDIDIGFRKIGLDTKKDSNTISLDRDKLKAAFESNGEQIFNMFTKDTNDNITHNITADEKVNIYKERGIFRRINSIIDDYSGSEGVFVKKAGYDNSRWSFTNDYTKSIYKQDKVIKEMEYKMSRKETSYYTMFAKLEKSMNSLNSQSDWLVAQLGGNN